MRSEAERNGRAATHANQNPDAGERIGFARTSDKLTVNSMTEPTSASSSATKKAPVLLVDDEKPLVMLFAEALAPYFEVDTATSAREAGYMMHKKQYKVIVCDHLMPGGNGLSFLVHVREEFPNTQRVLVTGYMKPEMLLRSVNEAALYRYLLKPVSLPELIKTVQEAARVHDQSAVNS
jgi:DNA-binding NtrC family response regulator